MRYHYRKRQFDFSDFTITKREIIFSIAIVAVMLIIGMSISNAISQSEMDRNEMYNQSVKIDTTELFQHGMETNVGNAFVYGDLKAVDTVTYPEIDGEYIYVKKVEERYERHERTVTKEDSDGNTYTEVEVYYSWDTEDTDSIHSKEINFCGIVFPYEKIDLPSSSHITTIRGDRTYSWKSGEYVRVRFEYYGIPIGMTGTIFTELKDNTIKDNSNFYENKNINETLEYVKSDGSTIIFWVFWILIICLALYGFYYLDNKWLEG